MSMIAVAARVVAVIITLLTLAAPVTAADYVFVRGEITAESAKEIIAEIRESDAETLVIDLLSPGGSVTAGQAIINAIAEASERQHVITRVRKQCASMCVAIWLAGEERLADAGASFMLHAVRDANSKAILPIQTNTMSLYYWARGVDATWTQTAVGRFIAGEDVYLWGADMLALVATPPLALAQAPAMAAPAAIAAMMQ